MIRITPKRLVVTTTLLFLLSGILVVTWRLCDWPPPRLILKYGFPPAGESTGERMKVEGIEFIELSAGYFRMGSHRNCIEGSFMGEFCLRVGLPWGRKPAHRSNECPPRWVEIPTSFWIAETEVTNEQFAPFDAKHVALLSFNRANYPVLCLGWDHAREFCAWLTRRSGMDCRLPAESEWEYACRAGTSGDLFFGSDDWRIGEFAWCEETSGNHPHVVGDLSPNPWGLFDVYGNAAEWCSAGSVDGSECVGRGGSYLTMGYRIASPFRHVVARPDDPLPFVSGIRPVIVSTRK